MIKSTTQLQVTTYEQLKACFTQSSKEFHRAFTKNENLMKSAIATIANAKNDNGWPLAMLNALQPQLAKALGHWSAGGYDDIRREQEAGTVISGTHASHLETYFSLLPRWNGEAQHFSKDHGWFNQLACGTLKLKSFMACCSPGHSFAYANPPAVILKFTLLKSARLVGALTTENLEGEVLLPKEAIFRVISVDKVSQAVCLKEMEPSALTNPDKT